MAVLDFSKERVTTQLEDCLALLHVLQALPMMSGELVFDAGDGEPYETLAKRLVGLHENIVQIAIHAEAISSRSTESGVLL